MQSEKQTKPGNNHIDFENLREGWSGCLSSGERSGAEPRPASRESPTASEAPEKLRG